MSSHFIWMVGHFVRPFLKSYCYVLLKITHAHNELIMEGEGQSKQKNGGVQTLEWTGMEWTTGMACKVPIIMLSQIE